MEEDVIKQPFLKPYAKTQGKYAWNQQKHMLTKVDNDVPYKRHNNTDRIILEEDFIKQPLLKLYAKLKGNINGLRKPHRDESRTRDLEQ